SPWPAPRGLLCLAPAVPLRPDIGCGRLARSLHRIRVGQAMLALLTAPPLRGKNGLASASPSVSRHSSGNGGDQTHSRPLWFFHGQVAALSVPNPAFLRAPRAERSAVQPLRAVGIPTLPVRR